MGSEITRTRGIRLVASGIAGTPGGRVWGVKNNGAAGTFRIRENTVGGEILWDSTILTDQWIQFTAPIRVDASAQATPGATPGGGAFIEFVAGVADLTIHVDY